MIIARLPFKVPTEPIEQARVEAIQARGGNPFTEHALPQAVIKLKQGFGRLIRSRDDRGCVLVLDSRIAPQGLRPHLPRLAAAGAADRRPVAPGLRRDVGLLSAVLTPLRQPRGAYSPSFFQ